MFPVDSVLNMFAFPLAGSDPLNAANGAQAWHEQSANHCLVSPCTGNWTQHEPLGFAAGQANLYQYVGNDPLNATDPTGEGVTQVPLAYICYAYKQELLEKTKAAVNSLTKNERDLVDSLTNLNPSKGLKALAGLLGSMKQLVKAKGILAKFVALSALSYDTTDSLVLSASQDPAKLPKVVILGSPKCYIDPSETFRLRIPGPKGGFTIFEYIIRPSIVDTIYGNMGETAFVRVKLDTTVELFGVKEQLNVAPLDIRFQVSAGDTDFLLAKKKFPAYIISTKKSILISWGVTPPPETKK